MESGLRSNGIPPGGFADPVISDGTGFRSDMPVSELTEHVTRAIEASDVNSTRPVAETMDGVIVTKTSRPSTESPLRAGARGKLDLRGDRTHGHRMIAKILGRDTCEYKRCILLLSFAILSSIFSDIRP